jgi:hypothetical protein
MSEFVLSFGDQDGFQSPPIRGRRRQSRSLKPVKLCKLTILVPEGSVEGLEQFARELRRRQKADIPHGSRIWRRLSPSAELMVDAERGARCAIRDTGATGSDRYHWTVTLFGEPDQVAAGRAEDVGKHDRARRRRY